MVFGMLFLLFALMHDIKLWTYTIPGKYISHVATSMSLLGLQHVSVTACRDENCLLRSLPVMRPPQLMRTRPQP